MKTITDFLIEKYGMKQMRQTDHPDDRDEFHQHKFSCGFRIHEIHYLFWSEHYKYFSLGVKSETPKGEAGRKGKRYWEFMMIPKPIHTEQEAEFLVKSICDFNYMRVIAQ